MRIVIVAGRNKKSDQKARQSLLPKSAVIFKDCPFVERRALHGDDEHGDVAADRDTQAEATQDHRTSGPDR